MSSDSESELLLTQNRFEGSIGEIDAADKLLPVYEFKENELVAGNFGVRAELRILPQSFLRKQNPNEASIQLATKKKLKQEIMHEYHKIRRNERVGVFEFGTSGQKNAVT